MKKFFDKIKKDYKYKKAGTGRRLDEERVVTPQTSSTVNFPVVNLGWAATFLNKKQQLSSLLNFHYLTDLEVFQPPTSVCTPEINLPKFQSTGSTGSASREYGTSAANAQAAAAAIARLEKKMMPKSASSMNKATLRAAREQNAQAKQVYEHKITFP